MSTPKPKVKPVGASAIATLTIEIGGLGSWGPDCTLQQIHNQAAESARNFVTNTLNHRARIIGEIEVKTIITER